MMWARCGTLITLSPAAVICSYKPNAPSAVLPQECTARCDPGYASNSTRSSATYVCSERGEWEAADGGRLRCALIGCPEARPVEHAHHCLSNEVGSSCETSCLLGYAPSSGSPLFNCSRNGKWEAADPVDGGALVCEAIRNFCDGNPPDESGYGQNIVMTDDPEKCNCDNCDNCHGRELDCVCEATCANNTAQVATTDASYRCVANGSRRDHRSMACGRLS